MDAVKQQLKQMYFILGIAYMLGCIILAVWQPPLILLSFTLGTLVSAVNFYLTYMAFTKLYQPAQTRQFSLFIGPLPKLVTIIGGTIICYQFPAIFSVVVFLVGVCLYPVVYLFMGTMDYITNKK